jgi:hypothetical protein
MRGTRVSLLIVLLAPFLVYSQDSNGIAGRSGTSLQFQLQHAPKIIQGPVVVGTGYDWAVVEWTTNAAGKSISAVYAGTAANHLCKAPQTAQPVTRSDLASYQEQQYTHLVRLNHLQAGTVYYFVVDSGPRSKTRASHLAQLATTKRPGLASWGLPIGDQ